MNLPADFISNIQGAFGEDGRKFLAALPRLIEEASNRWGLSNVEPVSNLSFNFVAFAKNSPSTARHSPLEARGSAPPSPFGYFAGTSQDVILKIGVPQDELTSEMAALRLYKGNGACRLLEYDEERGFLLLERLKPGTMLSELEDDDERTHIAVDVMSRLWREAPAHYAPRAASGAGDGASSNMKFIKLSDWFDGLKGIRPRFNGGTGPFPREILERVESRLPELFADQNDQLLHGDFHHFNILSSERGWLVIDPKGVIGPAGYEVGPLMINPWGAISDVQQFKERSGRRVSILAERLGWERETILGWATAHAVVSAWWCLDGESGDNPCSEYSIWCAERFSEIK